MTPENNGPNLTEAQRETLRDVATRDTLDEGYGVAIHAALEYVELLESLVAAGASQLGFINNEGIALKRKLMDLTNELGKLTETL